MKRLLTFFLFVSSLSLAQSTTVTGTITDTDGNLWANGTVTAAFVPNPTTPISQYVWTGGAITNIKGAMNGSGAFSISVPSLAYITPTNGLWNITVCPSVSGSCYGVNTNLVTGASVSLTTQLSAVAKGPRFAAAPSPAGYADVEALTPPGAGYFYWNVTDAAQRLWNGTTWTYGGGGGTIPATNDLLKGSGTAGLAAPASPGNDYISPNIFNGMNPEGTATTGTNQPSNQFAFESSYCTGSPCAPATDYFIEQSVPSGSTPNTLMLHEWNHSGSSGGALGIFAYSMSFPYQYGSLGNTVDAGYFGAKGDAVNITNGCTTTASSATVNCGGASFVSGDVAKQLWIQGAGTSGVAFHGTISTVNSGTQVVASATTPTAVSSAVSIYGHDDLTALQACFQYSASNAIQCVLNSPTGYLIGSGTLLMVTNNSALENSAMNVTGSSMLKGTNLFCEYNGDCMALASGPIQGANLANIAFEMDPTQPNSRAIHLNATAGTYDTGGLFNSNLTNVEVDNPALECMWMDGGGGPGYTYNLPNQIDTFTNLMCNGPNQMHTANLIKMTGQAAQISFFNGQINGYYPQSNYPNPLINITEKTPTYGDTPTDIKFFGATYEVGTQGLYIGNGANNIHYDNSYIEQIYSPLIVVGTVTGTTFNGNHIANSGNVTAVAQFSGLETASLRDNVVYGGTAPAAFAVCSGNNSIDFMNNSSSPNTTTGCATTSGYAGSTTLTLPYGTTASVTTSGGPIQTIAASGVSPGKTLTLYAPSGLQLESGGNISFGTLSSPLNVASGSYVILTLLDSGVTWLITGAPAGAVSSVTSTDSSLTCSPTSGNVVCEVNGTHAFTWNATSTYEQPQYYPFNGGDGQGGTIQMGPLGTPASFTNIYDDNNLHIDASSNTSRTVYVSGTALCFRATLGGTNEVCLTNTGALQLVAARKGTFICTAAGTITISNTNELATSDVVISLNAQGGTISTPPAMKTVTGGTGFTVLCGAADTSTYNYDILN
jgi:hypothetical protein